MTIIVQQPKDSNGNPQPMVYDQDTGKVIVDSNGYVLNGGQRLINVPSIADYVSTPKTQTDGFLEAVNYLLGIELSKGTSISGKIVIKNGTYNIVNPVYIPVLIPADPGVDTSMNLAISSGSTLPPTLTITPATIDKIDITFEGESEDGVILIMGDGVTAGLGGFRSGTANNYNAVNTTYKFKNMTWKPNPGYPAEGHTDTIEANLFSSAVSEFVFENITLTGIIGQDANFAIFTADTEYFNGFFNIIKNVKTRYIPGINLNPVGRVLISIKNLDLWNSGYTDNPFVINQGNDSTNKGLIIIDGVIIGQDEPVPSGITPGGSALFMLAGGTAVATTGIPATARVFAKNIKVYPLTQSGLSGFYAAQWNNVDAEIDIINGSTGAVVIGYATNDRIKVNYINTLSSNIVPVNSGSISNSEIELNAYNYYTANVPNPLIQFNNSINNLKITLNIYGYAFGTTTPVLYWAGSSSDTYTDVGLDGNLTDQLNNSTASLTNVSLISSITKNAIPFSQIAQNISPISTPSVPASATAQENTHFNHSTIPSPVLLYRLSLCYHLGSVYKPVLTLLLLC